MKNVATHHWTDAQNDFVNDAVAMFDELTIRDMYDFYAAKFGRWAASYNQFRTKFYCTRRPEIGRARAQRRRDADRLVAKLQTVSIAS